MLQNIVRDIGGKGTFLGHLSTSDFLIIASPEQIPALKQQVQKRIGQSLDYFYPLKDRLSGNFGERKLGLRLREFRISPEEHKTAEELRVSVLGR